jgi:hypothetical protein
MPLKSDQTEQPGADRFWGQFSQSRAGRSAAGEPAPDESAAEGQGAGGAGSHGADCLEWCPICRSAELFKNTVSPELRQQAESIQHEAIGVLKAFLDAYAEKSGEHGTTAAGHGPSASDEEPEEPPSPRVTEIPLD